MKRGENLKMVVRGLKEWGISASMGLEIGQYASFLCSGDYRPCGAGGFVLWRGSQFLILLFILFVIFVSECLEYCYYYFFFHGTLICFDLVKREKRV